MKFLIIAILFIILAGIASAQLATKTFDGKVYSLTDYQKIRTGLTDKVKYGTLEHKEIPQVLEMLKNECSGKKLRINGKVNIIYLLENC